MIEDNIKLIILKHVLYEHDDIYQNRPTGIQWNTIIHPTNAPWQGYRGIGGKRVITELDCGCSFFDFAEPDTSTPGSLFL